MTHLWVTLHNSTSEVWACSRCPSYWYDIKFQVSFSSCEHTWTLYPARVCEHVTNLRLQLSPLLKLFDGIHKWIIMYSLCKIYYISECIQLAVAKSPNHKKIEGRDPVVLLTLNHVQEHAKLPPSVQIFSWQKSSLGKICTKGHHINSLTERSS